MQSITEMPILKDRRVILGVTGSIAAYKAVDLASKLSQAGAVVDVILSAAARQFVTPITFKSVTGRNVYTEADLWGSEAHVLHVGLAEDADAYAIAPATAHTIAKLASGEADTLLTLAALASRAPLLIAPAMDAGMYENAATQANIETLRGRGAYIAGPAEGRMASGLVGLGRMVEPAELIGHIRVLLGKSGPLAGRRIVVTAGGTQEPLDPVRVIANRSSGKQGFALAQAAIDRGASVALITAPSHESTPIGARRIDVETAAQMKEATVGAVTDADVLLMAAAVADFRPVDAKKQKIKRGEGVPEVRLEPTDDILASVTAQRRETRFPQVIVGFAAESQSMIENALKKLRDKGIDLIVANDISGDDSGFLVDTNRVVIIDSENVVEELPLMTKTSVAEHVLDRVVKLIEK